VRTQVTGLSYGRLRQTDRHTTITASFPGQPK